MWNRLLEIEILCPERWTRAIPIVQTNRCILLQTILHISQGEFFPESFLARKKGLGTLEERPKIGYNGHDTDSYTEKDPDAILVDTLT